METVEVSHSAAGITSLLLPNWVARIETEARTDGKNEVTVVATKRYAREQWMAMPIAGQPSVLAVWVLLGQGEKNITEDRVRVVVKLPPSRMSAIRVQAFQPDA